MTASLTPRVQFLLVACAVAALALGGYLLLVAPKRSEAARLDEELESLRRSVALERPSRSRANADLVELFLLAKAMPDRTDIQGLIIDLDRLATTSGLELESLAPQAPVVGQGFQALPLQAVVEGSYASVSQFLRRLRDRVSLRGGRVHLNGRLYTVATIDLAEDDGGQLRATMTLNAYRFAAGTATAPGSTAPGAVTPPADTAPSP